MRRPLCVGGKFLTFIFKFVYVSTIFMSLIPVVSEVLCVRPFSGPVLSRRRTSRTGSGSPWARRPGLRVDRQGTELPLPSESSLTPSRLKLYILYKNEKRTNLLDLSSSPETERRPVSPPTEAQRDEGSIRGQDVSLPSPETAE